MFVFEHEATEQTDALTDFRYIGNEPKNFIKFNCDDDDTNCETWRILGVFSVDDGNGNVEQRIKLVRGSDFATEMSWDNHIYVPEYDRYSGYNDWTADNATLKLFLNRDYYNNTGEAQTNSYGLKASARNMIGDAKFYLGASETSGSTEEVYIWERGNTLCGSCGTNTSKLSWTGKVGLMYPSDEYMVYANGVNVTCYNNPYSCYENTSSLALPTTGWIYNTNILEGQSRQHSTWLLSSSSDFNNSVYGVFLDGGLTSGEVNGFGPTSVGVRPVVYLSSNVQITGGTGEVGNEYTLGLIQQ